VSRTRADQADGITRRRQWLRFRIGYIVILAAMALFTIKFAESAWTAHRTQLQVGAAAAAWHSQNQAIDRTVRQLRRTHEHGYVRDRARDWGYVMPGEALINIRHRHLPPVHHTRVASVKHADIPIWRQWWNVFLG
jgi:cell division protein FtsB